MSRDILIVRQDHLGDLVLTTPLIRALALAGHRVSVLARSSNLPVLEGNPYIRNLIALEDIAPSFPRAAWNLGLAVRKLAPDLVMVPHAKPASLLVGLRCGYFGPILTMWGGIASRFLLCRSLRSGLQENPRHMSDIWLDMARAINAAAVGLQPEIFLTEEEKEGALQILRQRFGSRKIVIVHSGCAGNTCNLPIGIYAELADKLLATTDVAIVLTGMTSEKMKYEDVLSPYDGHPRVWNSMGNLSIRQLCAVISQAKSVVSVGTGPMHIASALGISTVSPFCRRVGVCSRVWGNIGAKSLVLEPPASICKRVNTTKYCDFQGEIQPAQLLNATLEILNNR